MVDSQFVIFRLESEMYAVDIKNVGGISEYKEITTVPNSPYFIQGIINLRGEIIPIVNLKRKFHIPEKEVDSETRIVINRIAGKDIGFIVDEASQVKMIEEQNIENAPDIVKGRDHDYIQGVGKMGEDIVIILDLEKILTNDEKDIVLAMEDTI